MNIHDSSVKQPADTQANHTSHEEQLPDTSLGLDSFYNMRRAIQKPNHETLTPTTLMQLQRTIGNRAVQRLLTGNNRSKKAAPNSSLKPVQNFKQNSQIQRWITLSGNENNLDPIGYIPLKGKWHSFDADRFRNDPSYQAFIRENFNAMNLPSAPGQAPKLLVQPDPNRTNNRNLSITGCFHCAVADFLGIEVGTLLDMISYFVPLGSVNADAMSGILNRLSIAHTQDLVDSFGELLARYNTPGGSFECLLAWTGHIIRARITSTGLELWDPQSTSPYLLPIDAPQYAVYTLVTRPNTKADLLANAPEPYDPEYPTG